MRTVIVGGSKCGKTTQSACFGPSILHCDDLMATGTSWSGLSEEVSWWLDRPGPWCIEGVQASRALRKWLAAHPEGKPCDQVIRMSRPHLDLSEGQLAMNKGEQTVWEGIVSELRARGVEVYYR